MQTPILPKEKNRSCFSFFFNWFSSPNTVESFLPPIESSVDKPQTLLVTENKHEDQLKEKETYKEQNDLAPKLNQESHAVKEETPKKESASNIDTEIEEVERITENYTDEQYEAVTALFNAIEDSEDAPNVGKEEVKQAIQRIKDAGIIHIPLLTKAVAVNNLNTVQQLLDAGANPNKLVNMEEDNDHAPLLVAINNLIHRNVVFALLKSGAKTNIQTKAGNTPLILEVNKYNTSIPVVEALLSSKASVNIKNKEKKSALYFAIENAEFIENAELKPKKNEHLQIIELLLNAGAEIDQQIDELYRVSNNEKIRSLIENALVKRRSPVIN